MITKGKWQTGCDMSRVEVWPEGWNAPLLIADCGTKRAPELVEEQCANAQAVAALPDLIEALHDLVHLFPQFCRDADEWIQYRNAQSALKRAGIEVGR